MSAVSKWFTPASSAASTTRFDAASSIRMPKLLHPRPATDTSRLPTLRISIAASWLVVPIGAERPTLPPWTHGPPWPVGRPRSPNLPPRETCPVTDPASRRGAPALARAEVRGDRRHSSSSCSCCCTRRGAFSGVNNTVTDGVNRLAGFGLVGIFLIALVANLSILMQIPYTLPLLSAALGGASLQNMLGLGVASGLGAGIGAVASYKVADALVAKTPGLPEGRTFRWIARNVDDRPRATSFGDLPHRALTAARRRRRGAAGGRALRHAPAGGPAVPREVLPQRAAGAPLLRLRLVVVGPRLGEGEHRAGRAVAVLFMVLVGYHAEKARASSRAGLRRSPAVGAESSHQPDPPNPSRCDHGSNCS